jgi:hypothetical protein
MHPCHRPFFPHPWLASIAFVALSACQSQSVPTIQILVGPLPEERRVLQPRSALAEVISIPGQNPELRLIVASNEVSCDGYQSTPTGQVRLTLTFQSPPAEPLGPGVYSWLGSSPEISVGAAPKSRTVLPHVRIGPKAHELPSGGTVELTAVDLESHGSVSGILRLEQPGDMNVSATSVLGSFTAKICPKNAETN